MIASNSPENYKIRCYPESQKLKNLGDLSTLNLSLFYLLDVLPQ